MGADSRVGHDTVARTGPGLLDEVGGAEPHEKDLVEAGAVAQHSTLNVDGVGHDGRAVHAEIGGGDDLPGLRPCLEGEAIAGLGTPALGIYALRDSLDGAEDYDYVLVDCPPSLGILTANALAAAHEVVIPLQADYLALKGVDLLLKTIAKIQKRANKSLAVRGIVLTMADLRTVHAREVVEAARETFGQTVRVLDTIIHANVRLKEAPLTGQSILAYAPDSPGALGYRALAQEIDS